MKCLAHLVQPRAKLPKAVAPSVTDYRFHAFQIKHDRSDVLACLIV